MLQSKRFRIFYPSSALEQFNEVEIALEHKRNFWSTTGGFITISTEDGPSVWEFFSDKKAKWQMWGLMLEILDTLKNQVIRRLQYGKQNLNRNVYFTNIYYFNSKSWKFKVTCKNGGFWMPVHQNSFRIKTV